MESLDVRCLHASAGLSARERNRLKRLAKQNQKRGGPAEALPAAKRAKADANGSSTVLHHQSCFITHCCRLPSGSHCAMLLSSAGASMLQGVTAAAHRHAGQYLSTLRSKTQ